MATRKDYQPVVIAYVVCIAAAIGTLWWIHGAYPQSEWRPLWAGFAADFVATVVIFIYSRVYKNSSFYDPYWSVIPPLLMIYWMLCYPASVDSLRVWIMLALVWAWGIRLTANWSIYWPGLHHEDWRYPLVRERAGRFAIPADFMGIHFFPTVQVFLGCLPILVVVQNPSAPLGWLDA
ncbi:MAG: DUF1295 domain-containing protein, partial [Nevskiales bacterium]